jgi:hypothetical protein
VKSMGNSVDINETTLWIRTRILPSPGLF